MKVFFFPFFLTALFAHTAFSQYPDSLQEKLGQAGSPAEWTGQALHISYANASRYPFFALKLARQAYDTAEVLQNNILRARALSRIGVVHYYLANYETAIDFHYKAYILQDSLGAQDEVPISLNNLALAFQQNEDYSRAIDYYIDAAKGFEEAGAYIPRATVYNNLGTVFRNTGDLDSAMYYYKKSLEICRIHEDKRLLMYNYNNLGNLYIDLGSYAAAYQAFTRALEMAYQLDNKYEKANIWLNLGRYFIKTQQYEIARDTLALADAQVKQLGANQLLAELLSHKITLAEKSRDYKQKSFYCDSLLQVKSLLMSKEKEKQVKRLQALHNLKSFKAENQLLRNELHLKEKVLKNRNLAIATSFAAILLAVVLIWVKTRSARMRQRAGMELETQNRHIENQNEELRQQQEKLRHNQSVVEEKNKLLHRQNDQMYKSIEAASLLQAAILPGQEKVVPLMGKYFIMYRPKDVVSGDFYWIETIANYKIVVIADCTGHGVTGALLTTIAHTLLNNIIRIDRVTQPAAILKRLNAVVNSLLNKYGNREYYGMDMSILRIEEKVNDQRKAVYAGAKNPLLYFTPDGRLVRIKGTRKSIGSHNKLVFVDNELNIPSGSIVYMYTDGIVDQVRADNKRYGSKRFQEQLEKIYTLPMVAQRLEIEQVLNQMLLKQEQRDDILVFGTEID